MGPNIAMYSVNFLAGFEMEIHEQLYCDSFVVFFFFFKTWVCVEYHVPILLTDCHGFLWNCQ